MCIRLLLVTAGNCTKDRRTGVTTLRESELTPMMQQYMETKKQYPDCILFYRLGDFYDLYFVDSLSASIDFVLTLSV